MNPIPSAAATVAARRRLDRLLSALSDGLSSGVQRLARVPGLRWLGNVRVLLTIGLVGMVVTAHLGASWIGLLPDPDRLRAESRAALAEVLVAGAMSSLGAGDHVAVEELLRFAIEREPAIRSAAVRRSDGEVLASAGPHPRAWASDGAQRSTTTEITVPLYAEGARWGRLEVALEAPRAAWLGPLGDSRNAALLLIALSCCIGFYLYLGRSLKELTPSRAVPPHMRAAFDTFAEGMMLLDQDGRIIIANAALCRLLGRPMEALEHGSPGEVGWCRVAGGPIADADLPWMRALAGQGGVRQEPIELPDPQGGRRSFQVNCSPLAYEGGATLSGVMVSFDEVTELRRTQAELREATEQAQSANRAKSDFLANMSHEIRTPMNAILGFTQMLRLGRVRDAAQARRHLDTVHANGSHLLALINDILDLSKVEAGQLVVEQIPFAPHEVLGEVVETLSVRAAEKGVGLRRAVDGPVPALALGDPARLRQVVTNLVGNAIKFTDRGEVVVTERWLPAEGGRGARLEVRVSDSGVGIPQDRLESIFEPFVQADSSTTRKYGGTGLGLAIARRFARAMGGDVVASSEPGRGSTFTVTIDPGPGADGAMLAPEQALAERTSEAGAAHAWRFPPRRLLVVDDSPENRELVALVLQDCGLVVEQADSGEAALAAVERRVPDLVLMDMQMPGMDGFTATRTLRERGVTVPIYAFTAHALRGFEHEIRDAGCDGHLTKPIDIDAMMETLAGRLGGTRVDADPAAGGDGAWVGALVGAAPASAASPASARATESSATATSAPSSSDDDGPLRSRLAGHARLGAIVDAFAARLPERIARMRASFDAGDLVVLAEEAHWLKGSAGTVGFDPFTAPARRLESAARAGDREGAALALAEVAALGRRIDVPAAAEVVR